VNQVHYPPDTGCNTFRFAPESDGAGITVGERGEQMPRIGRPQRTSRRYGTRVETERARKHADPGHESQPDGKTVVSGSAPTTVTSYDVAQLAGVSQSAVSRCFRPDASISKRMRERVMKAARDLGYAPDAIARSLTTRRSNLVAVIISNLTNLYYPEVLSELNQQLTAHNVHLLLFTIQAESDVDRILGHVWQYRVDGVIAAARLSEQQVEDFERRRVPLVFYNRYMRERSVNAVCCDQIEGARAIINGLVDAGHRSFGIVGGPEDSLVGEERTQGCLDSLKQRGMRQIVRVRSDYTYDGGRRAFGELVAQLGKPPEAVVCANDVMALGCLDAARFDHRLEIPDAVSVVGFDGVAPGGWSSYQLATIRQPVQRMAEAAVALLLECIGHPGRPVEKRVFSGTLVPGQSARLQPPVEPRRAQDSRERAPTLKR
jgi:DNA-binding LacI/PurR family transcriptional regulator